jgi:tetratricopeptide (TPR) repeat protein
MTEPVAGKGESAWEDVRRVFEDVASLDEHQREAALEAACAGDDLLRSTVEALLRADREVAESFLVPVSPEHLSETLDQGWAQGLIGTRISAYELRSLLGAGGMGLVFEAVQDDPRRTVALKVMRPGAVSDVAFARFREEAGVLGRLQHPAVAQVIEAGLERTAQGVVPWFAMVAIPDARDILTYAQEQGLDDASRVDLLLEVLAGVHHGHLRGVIHCDLKPSNLLVDGEGRPYVIDFGVARLESPGEEGGASRRGPAGTWRYMAPEQLGEEPPDLRADVYSLGVVLYELLCQGAPLDFEGSTSVEERAEVVQFQPPVPPRRRRPDLPRDLERILLKALAKDPAERYGSVSALADDLVRERRGLPVEAAPASGLYRAGKFVRRNRRWVALVGVLALVGAFATVAVLTSYKEAAESYRVAAEEGERASAVYGFLVKTLVEPFREAADGDDVRFVDVITRSAEEIDARFESMPRVRGELHVLYGNIYGGLWKNEPAVHHMRLGLELMRGELEPGDPELFRILSDLGDVLGRAGRTREATALFKEALDGPGRAPDQTRLALLVNLSTLRLDQGDYDQAEPVAREAFDLARTILPDGHPLRLTAESNWAAVLEYGYDDHEGAIELLARVAEAVPRTPRDRHPDVVRAKVNLAVVYGRTGRLVECAELLEEALAEQRRVFSTGHPATMGALQNLAQVRQRLGDLEQAEALRLERLAAMRTTFAADDPVLLASVSYHGEWLIALERPEDALAFWLGDLELRGVHLDRASASMLKLRWRAALLQLELGRVQEAAVALAEVLEDHAALPPSPGRDEDTAVIRLQLGRALLLIERPEQAEPHLALARSWVEQHAPQDVGEALDARLLHGRALQLLERTEEARACLEAVDALLAERPDDPRAEQVAAWLRALDADG